MMTTVYVQLGEEGTVSIGRRGEAMDWSPALDVDPDNADADCLVELRTCSSCWINLSVIVNRFDTSKVAAEKNDQYQTTVYNATKSDAVMCQLWSVLLSCLHINTIHATCIRLPFA